VNAAAFGIILTLTKSLSERGNRLLVMPKRVWSFAPLRKWLSRVVASDRSPADASPLDDAFTERERAQVTLDAIGDAVASTDFRGQVVYLNKAAERLTGYDQAAATRLPVAQVFRLVNASSGAAVNNPTAESIIDNEKRFAPDNSILVRRDGTKVPVEVSSTPIHDRHGGVVGAVMVARDMTAARELSEKLSRLALYDHLTGLPNRILFADRLDHAISRGLRTGSSFCLLYIDLDNFKTVNDTLGHEAGDRLLCSAAERLQECIRQSDTVSRHGGDEFVALLIDCTEVDAGFPCAFKIVEALSAPYDLDGRQAILSASVGIAVFPTDATEREQLMRAADFAMYRAKCSGRNGFQRYDGSTRLPEQSKDRQTAIQR
jgi:diguanylate cyclase (GGDEF)-like protein/PAS domain S-box-containing protein